jgi:hypothetical protein
VDELQITLSNVSDGASEIIVIDGENITLTDANTGTTAANSYDYSISLSGTTVSVTLTTTGTSVAEAQNLVDGLAYRNTSSDFTTATRVVTLTSIKDSGGAVNGGVDTSSLSVSSTVMITTANPAPTVSFEVADQTLTGSDSMRLQLPTVAVPGGAQFDDDGDLDPEIVELTNTRVVDDQSLSDDSQILNSVAGIEVNAELDRNQLYDNDAGPLKPKYIDLQHLELRKFETMNTELLELDRFVPDSSFFESLDELGKDLEESIDDEMSQMELSASVTALVVTTGVMSWILRAGSLLGGFLSVIPLWRQFDPLPILVEDKEKENLTADDKEETETDDVVETLFDK